ncbi:MAG: ATP-grasp domain-containing protein [Candidatus Doudnabacteria bacterium]|nr:ATP-grasp domain-containing protein [Candidatus Doudnabacteria bacterium]
MRILAISSSETYASKRLFAEAGNLNCEFVVMPIVELAEKNFIIEPGEYDVLYIRNPYVQRSPKYLKDVISLAKKFKNRGKRVVDEVIADGLLGGGKWDDYRVLFANSLPIPKTELFSMQSEFLKQDIFIAKWIYGFKGKNVFLVKSGGSLPGAYPESELMLQEFVNAEYEYKVITAGYKALPVILKFAINKKTKRPDFKNYQVLNISTTAGDHMLAEAVSLAQKAAKILGRELAKTDILESNGKLYILEVNRFPGLQSFEALTKFNVAREFVKYLVSGAKKAYLQN